MTRPKGERTVRWSAKRVVLAKTLIEQPDIIIRRTYKPPRL